MKGGRLYYRMEDKPKRGKAICKGNQQRTLDNRCYDLDEGELVDSEEQEYESDDVDSLFDGEDELDVVEDKSMEIKKLKDLDAKITKVYNLMKRGGVMKKGINYLDKNGKKIMTDRDVEYFGANKYKLGRR